MPEDTIATDEVVDKNNISDAVDDSLEAGKVTDDEITPVVDPPDGGTVPKKPDADEAKNAFKYREEKRLRKEAESKLAEATASNAAPTQDEPVMPKLGDFETNEAYDEAMGKYQKDISNWTYSQREAQKASKEKSDAFFDANEKAYESFVDKSEEAVKKYPDFHEKLKGLDFTDIAREAIYKSENSAEIAYHIATNPDLVKKLGALSSVDTVREITRLDSQMSLNLKKKTTSKAPEPITPVDEGKTGITDESKMSTKQWIKNANEEEAKTRR